MATALSLPTSVVPASRLAPVESRYPALETPAGIKFPRGRITEVYGSASSGRTSLLYSALERACGEGESCALVDTSATFDPASASAAGVELHRLLWVRCGGNSQHAMRVADLLLQGNGFGLVAVDFASLDPREANRIPSSYWHRFRLAVEQTRTALIVVSPMPNVRQCAALAVEARRQESRWSGTAGCSQLFEGISLAFDTRKPPLATTARFEARAISA